MGQINLFAHTLTDAARDFLATYRDGELREVGSIRLLEESKYPRSCLPVQRLEHSFVITEVADPLIWADITWLYQNIVGSPAAYEEDREERRTVYRRYAMGRVMNPNGEHSQRPRVETDEQWAQIRALRSALEPAALALKHYANTYEPDGFVDVQRVGNFLVIEYKAKPPAPRVRVQEAPVERPDDLVCGPGNAVMRRDAYEQWKAESGR